MARFWHRLRRAVSRTEWLIRLLGLHKTRGGEREPGLIMVQIDGLSRRQFERALAAGRMPFLARLLRRNGHRLRSFYSGLPSSTPAVQGELFYGVATSVPAFGFFDERFGRLVRMHDADAAAAVEENIERHGPALLEGGTSYMNVYTGGAEEAHFCASQLSLSRLLRSRGRGAMVLALLLNPLSLVRIAAVFVLEILLAFIDCARGIIAGRDLWKELKFVPVRVGICILARELITISAQLDAARGFPIVHLNLLGYDEQAHRRGPSARFAHWTLGGIDNAIKRIWRKARCAPGREYDLYVYSDHGQEDVQPYQELTGATIQAVIRGLHSEDHPQRPETAAEQHGIQSQRWGLLRAARSAADGIRGNSDDTRNQPLVTGMGPIGLVYWPQQIDLAERRRLARKLVDDHQLPLVMFVDDQQRVQAASPAGDFVLPDDAADVLGRDHPHVEEAGQDLVDLCRHPRAGTFVLSGYRDGHAAITFPLESGSHAGPGIDETTGFALLPDDAPLPEEVTECMRPRQLRETVMTLLGRRAPRPPTRVVDPTDSTTVRVLTYNVHSCIGMDGRLSPRRIARVVAQADADIVALQELDRNRRRTGSEDQAREIARLLRMEHHFHPALRVADEHFGNAVLSRLPMRLHRAGPLPQLPTDPRREPRAVMWVEVSVNGVGLQLFNTHLGLRQSERLVQVRSLLGRDWYGHPECSSPAIVCGDFNALPRSVAYQKVSQRLRDVQKVVDGWRPQATWPASWPVRRIDYVFTTPDVRVTNVRVLDSELARVASDHRPVLVELEVRASKASAEN